MDDPEFTSVCPKTGLPDFGNIVIRYEPDRLCLELKSLKEYLQAYRNLGIFQENIVNQVLEDVVRWAKPVWAEVKGEFRPRGGISTVVIARWPREKKRAEVSGRFRTSQIPRFSSSPCYIRSTCDPDETLSSHRAGAPDGAEPAQLHRPLRAVRSTGSG